VKCAFVVLGVAWLGSSLLGWSGGSLIPLVVACSWYLPFGTGVAIQWTR
jgi:hypothetical protein